MSALTHDAVATALAEKKLAKAISVLISPDATASERFFGINASAMERVMTFDRPTMATNGLTLLANPRYVLDTQFIELVGVVIHEAWHRGAKHAIRLRDYPPHLRKMVHVAADYAVNLGMKLDPNIRYPLPSGTLLDERFVDQDGRALNVEAIFAILIREAEQRAAEQEADRMEGQQDSQQETGDSDTSDAGDDDDDDDGTDSNSADSDDSDGDDDGCGSDDSTDDDSTDDTGSADGSDDDSDSTDDSAAGSADSGENSEDQAGDSQQETEDTPDPFEPTDEQQQGLDAAGELDPAPDDADEQQQQTEVCKASMLAGAGDMPGYIKDMVSAGNVTARQDWMAEVKAEIAREFDKSDFSMRFPNPRYAYFGVIAPTLRAPGVGRIAVVSDVSGSMDPVQRNVAIANALEIVREYNPREIEVIHHTSRIVFQETLQQGQEPEPVLKGTGGTRAAPVFKELEKDPPDAVLWFSDMEFFSQDDGIPEPNYPVIWLGTNKGAEWWLRKRFSFGKYITVA